MLRPTCTSQLHHALRDARMNSTVTILASMSASTDRCMGDPASLVQYRAGCKGLLFASFLLIILTKICLKGGMA